uniref:SH2 domain-containing protein n=1 Tax=Seriola lalandi dorsalis TaxID=1841481 RepID=A0A3B4X4E4_SERLL
MAAALPVCYHGAMSRKECEDLLGKKNKDGAYLIRDSETIHGAMCLCASMCQTSLYLNSWFSAAGGVEETFFKNLEDLIRHYKRKNQGLAMHLRHSVKRKTALLIKPPNPPGNSPGNPPRNPPRNPPGNPPEEEEEDPFEEPDYESMSYVFFTDLSHSIFFDSWCI